jgi:long-chain acyl-CoA synthetase
MVAERSATVWLFDLDGCLVDSLTASHVRPHAKRLLDALIADGVEVRIWSAGGADYAREVASRVGLADRVTSFHDKVRLPTGHWQLPDLAQPVRLVCVDDQPEGVPPEVHTIAVHPYIGEHRHDRTFARLLDRLPHGLPDDRID